MTVTDRPFTTTQARQIQDLAVRLFGTRQLWPEEVTRRIVGQVDTARDADRLIRSLLDLDGETKRKTVPITGDPELVEALSPYVRPLSERAGTLPRPTTQRSREVNEEKEDTMAKNETWEVWASRKLKLDLPACGRCGGTGKHVSKGTVVSAMLETQGRWSSSMLTSALRNPRLDRLQRIAVLLGHPEDLARAVSFCAELIDRLEAEAK